MKFTIVGNFYKDMLDGPMGGRYSQHILMIGREFDIRTRISKKIQTHHWMKRRSNCWCMSASLF